MDAAGIIEILLVVALSSLLSFGGGNGQIPMIQGRWVDTGRLAPELFAFALALSYLTPGPRAGFLGAIGYYLAGFPGAVAAVVGILVPTCLGAGAVSLGLDRIQSVVRRLTPSSGFVIAGLIAATAWGTARPLDLAPAEMVAVAVVTVVVVWRGIDPLRVVLAATAIGGAWALFAR
jgi:chromate transporter